MFASSHDGAAARFNTTRWSVVLAAAVDGASPDSNTALADLCGAYWYPLYAFIRRKGHDADGASDLTQAFFARFLEKKYLLQVDRTRGRFRSFLLASLNHFLADERDRSRAQKRGGGKAIVSLEGLRDAEGRYALEPSRGLTAEQIFERRWALTLLEHVLARLREDFGNAGKRAQFDRLKGFLMFEGGAIAADSYAKAAVDCGMTEGAVKVAVHRLKQRYSSLLREEIAATVGSEDEIDDEIRCLFEALA